MKTISERLDEFFSSYTPALNKGLRENRVERMKMLLAHLGNPEQAYKTIHVAGSKGKGTTASFLSAILDKVGVKCGLYLSPHVYDVRERFTEATRFFPTALYEETLEELEAKVKEFTLPEEYGPERPTTFELYTAYAYLLFQKAKCQFAVIETGLGGRLDATNTIDPVCAVITKIEKEHTNILGTTLREISTEKSGIMRHRRDTFLLDQKEEVLDVFQEKAKEIGSDLHIFSFSTKDVDRSSRIKTLTTAFDNRKYTLTLETDDEVTMLDAFYALYILHKMQLIPVGSNSFFFTSFNFFLPARYEERSYAFFPGSKTDLILDGAHTVESIRSTMATFLRDMDNTSFRKTALVFSCAEDKDSRSIMKELFPFFETIVITTIGEYKKCNPEKILQEAKEEFPEKTISFSQAPRRALERAIRRTEGDGIILVTGSFYLCAEMDKALQEMGYGR